MHHGIDLSIIVTWRDVTQLDIHAVGLFRCIALSVPIPIYGDRCDIAIET